MDTEKLYKIRVTEELVGQRIDKALSTHFKDEYSRTFLKRVIDTTGVTVNGALRPEKYKVKLSDVITITIPVFEDNCHLTPENIPLDILYEDDYLIVVNKQSRLVVHPGAGNKKGTLVHALLYHFNKLSNVGGDERPGIVHRLDKDTSGCMIVAKTNRAHRNLAKQFESKKMLKIYRGYVSGVLEFDNGIINKPIGRDGVHRKKMTIDHSGKDATTQYHTIRRFEDFTEVEFNLHTGRTHQIRVHMANMGHPIIGDKEYGRDMRMSRQALHAYKIGFTHPREEKYMEFTADIPADMQEFINGYQ